MKDGAAAFDVFSAREIAQAAGVPERDVVALITAGHMHTIDGRFVDVDGAVAAVQRLRLGKSLIASGSVLFQHAAADRREAGLPLVGSVLVHAAMIGGAALLLAAGPTRSLRPQAVDTSRLVFLATPGPGGGGGGGGLRQPEPAAAAKLNGRSRLSSPVVAAPALPSAKAEPAPVPPVEAAPAPKPVEPPPPQRQVEPPDPVVAPVAAVASDAQDRPGLPDGSRADARSNGQGQGGGSGTGMGTGLGQGVGNGVGPGSGGGTGGGPYRPGNGIVAPTLVREVKPEYTEEARRRTVDGDVELEIVVRRDGSVGEVRLLRGLGAGLDQRAIDAVRQWRFTPARRLGTPVDVLVEVAVEFRLR